MNTPHSGLAETMQALADGCVCDYCAAMRARINDAVLSTAALHIARASYNERAAYNELGPLRRQLENEQRTRRNVEDRLDELLVERAALIEALDAILSALEKTKLITVKR